MKDYDEIRLRRYLLDQLSQDEKDQVEQDLLVDDDLFEAAEAVEDDLLDSYCRGELTAAERESIVRRLATSPRGQARLELVQGLSALAGPGSIPASGTGKGQVVAFPRRMTQPFVRFAIAASLVGAVALGLWTWTGGSPAEATVALIAFSVNETQLRNRGGDRQTATLSSPGLLRIELHDLEEEDFPAYEVVVSRAGEEVARERLASGQKSVDVSAEKLPEGWYGLEVRGLPADGEPRPVILSEFEIVAE